MDDSIDMRDSAVTRIIDGSITIDSLSEFENLLNIFPDNPRLHRVFADFLAQEKSFDAVDSYRILADLFTKAGQTLQAVVSKIFEWRLAKPSHQEEQEFYSDLHKGSSKEVPVQRFFAGLAFEQLIAFMNELTPRYIPEKVRKKTKKDLIENDFFGEIYPFEEEKVSQTVIKTIPRVELAEISKSMLTKICRQNPDVEPLIDRLYQARLESDEKEFTKIVRKTVRHQLPTQINLKVFQDHGDRAPLELSGFTNDISLGGASVILGATYQIGHSFNLIGRNVKIQICLPIESIAINMLGTIVWGKDVPLEGKTTVIVGIRFKEMTDIDRELLKEYCYGSEGEQNLIWSLWNSLLEK